MTDSPSWRKKQRQNFTNLQKLLDFLEIDAKNREKILFRSKFPLNLPLRLAEKIQKNCLEDPLFRQFVPLKEESVIKEGFSLDALSEKDFTIGKKLLQKYEKRALFITTSACAMNCRFCFRQNFDYESQNSFEEEFSFLEKNKEIEEIILSGGDPLSLSNVELQKFFNKISSFPQIQRIRFHTRFPIGIPERIDSDFLNILKNTSKQVIFVLHVNHPRELDQDIIESMGKIQELKIPILTQTVLLKKVNDDVETLSVLLKKLINHGIIPYYLHQLDKVHGTAHFEVSEKKGRNLIQELKKILPGYAVFRYVREIAGEQSKTELNNSLKTDNENTP